MQLIGAGSSILGSFLSGQPKTTTTNSTTTPTFTPTGAAVNGQLQNLSSQLLNDPAAGTQATNLNGIDAINQQYAQMPDQVSQQLAARGFGQSGKLGTAMYNVANAKATAQSGWQSQMAQLISSRQMQGASLGDQLLQLNRGTTSNSTTTGPNTSLADMFGSIGNAFGNASQISSLGGLAQLMGYGSGSGPTQSTTNSWGTIPGEQSGGGPLTSPTVKPPQ